MSARTAGRLLLALAALGAAGVVALWVVTGSVDLLLALISLGLLAGAAWTVVRDARQGT